MHEELIEHEQESFSLQWWFWHNEELLSILFVSSIPLIGIGVAYLIVNLFNITKI